MNQNLIKNFYLKNRIQTPLLLFAFTALPVSDYLKQVLSESPAVQSAQQNSDGALLSSKEGNLIFAPTLISQLSHYNDQKEPANPFNGTRNLLTQFSTGVQKQFDFGLNSKLTYNLISAETLGLSPTIFPGGALKYTTASTQLELSQSLWRNFLGSESKANSTLAEASSMTTHYAERFKLKQLKAQAESAYYRLAFARQTVFVQTELLEGSKKILNWATKRVRNQLTDKTDMLQAQAAYQSREIELLNQIEEERTARLQFNTLRNISNEDVQDKLEPPAIQDILQLEIPKKADMTDDIKAAEYNEQIQSAQNELSLQRANPDLAVFGSIASNGVDRFSSPAISEALTLNQPTYLMGIRLSMPLTVFDTSDIRKGRARQKLAAESMTRQKRLENEQTWIDLTKKFTEAKKRLKLVDALVKAQTEKMNHEKSRLNLGRTTTYQVQLFEQDYVQAILMQLRMSQEIIAIHSQLKTYAAE